MITTWKSNLDTRKCPRTSPDFEKWNTISLLSFLVWHLLYQPWTLAASSMQPCFSLQTSQIIERHMSAINQTIISRKKEDRTERAFLCKRLFGSVAIEELVKITRRVILFGNISWFTKSLSAKMATLYKSQTSCWSNQPRKSCSNLSNVRGHTWLLPCQVG